MKANLSWLLSVTIVLISTNNAKGRICEVWYANTPAALAKSSDLVLTTKDMLPAYSHNAVFLQKDAINWFFLPPSIVRPTLTVDGPCEKKATFEVVRDTEGCHFDFYHPEKCACASIPGIANYHRIGIKLWPNSVTEGCFFYATDIKVYDAAINRFLITEVRVLPSDVEAANKRLAGLNIVHPLYPTTTTTTTTALPPTTALPDGLISSTTTPKTAKAEIGILVVCFFSALLIGGAIIGVIVGIDCMLVRIAKNETTRLTSASKGSASTVHTGKLPSGMNQHDKTQQTQNTVESMDTVEKTKEVASNRSVKSIKSPKSESVKSPKKIHLP